MKKLSLLVLVVMILTVVLTACGHEHTYGDAWQTDATSHWNKAVCEHSSETANKADHADTNGDGICDTCKYVMHTHTYATEWSVDETNHWNAASCAHTAEVSNKAAHTDVNNDKVCDVCAYNYNHTHTYATEWTYDATNHWNAASCGCTIAHANVAAHADGNNDGACDVCGHIAAIEHTYEEKWTYDEESHWLKATCGHDVVGEKAAHTLNVAGVCEVCTYNAGTLDVTTLTLADAIEIGLISKYSVSGTVKEIVFSELLNSENTVIYEFGDGFFYSASDFTQSVWDDWSSEWYNYSSNVKSYYYLLDDGRVWSVIDEGNGATKNPNEITTDVFNGYYFDGSLFNYSVEATYGVEEFIDKVYNYALANATFKDLSADISLSEGITVYAFSYAEIVGSDLVEYAVAFSLDPDTYYVNKVEMAASYYEIYDEDGNVLITTGFDEEWNEIELPVATLTFDSETNALTSYVLADGYEAYKTAYAEVEQADTALDDMYSPEYVAAKYFELYLKTLNEETSENEYTKVEGTINAEAGEQISIVIKNFIPKSVNFDFDTVVLIDEDGNEIGWYVDYGFFNVSSDTINITITEAGEYNLTVKSTFYETALSINVTAPAVSEINPTVNGETATESTVFVGESTIIGATVNQYANGEFTVAITEGNTEIGTLNLDKAGDYVFTATAAGTWTITVTSVENAEITETLTLTVKDLTPVDVETFFNNTYKGYDENGWSEMTVVFNPSAENVTVGTVDVTLSSNYGDTTVTYNYTYNVETRNLKLTFEGGFDMLGVTLSISGDAKLVGDQMGSKFNLAVSTGDEEVTINADYFVDKTYSATVEGVTWYISFTYYEGVYSCSVSDTAMGRPMNSATYTYTVEYGRNNWGQSGYFFTLVPTGGGVGTVPTFTELVYMDSYGMPMIMGIDSAWNSYMFVEHNPLG